MQRESVSNPLNGDKTTLHTPLPPRQKSDRLP